MSSTGASENNPTGETEVAAVVEETPRNNVGSPVLNPHQQRETMAGNPPNGGTAPVAAPEHKGIKAAMQKTVDNASPTDITNECNAFMTLVNNYSDDAAKKFFDKVTSPFNDIKVFASMKKTGVVMQVLWAIGQYTAVDPNWDMPGDKKLACAGDRNKFGHAPTMLALPRDNTVKWKKVKADWEDNESFLATYNDTANRQEFLTMSNQGSDKLFPRVLYLIYHLGVFACDNHTPFELYGECERWKGEDNNPYPAEYLEFIQNWCRAAMFKAEGNASVLQLDADPVTADTEAFQNWRQKMMVYYLGEFEQSQTPATAAGNQGAAPQQNSTEKFDHIEAMAERILKVAAVKQMELVNDIQKTSPTGLNPIKGTQVLDGVELYDLMTFCNIMNPQGIPIIWKHLYGSSASAKQKRQELMKQMLKWAKANHKPINKLIRFEKHFLDDVKEVNMGFEEGRATWVNLERGWSLQNCLPVTANYITKAEKKERAADNTQHTRTLAEQEELSKSDPKPPPKTVEALKLAVATGEALAAVCLTEGSDLTKKLGLIWEALDGPDVVWAEHCYTPEVIASYWFDILDAIRAYFFRGQSKEDFESPSGPIFPRLMINHILEAIKAGRKVENGMFPYLWKKAVTPQPKPPPTQQASQHYLPPPTVPKPQGFGPVSQHWMDQSRQPFSDKTNHCHPLVLEAMAGVHKMTQGIINDVTLNKIMQKPNQIRNAQLPIIRNYMRGKDGKLNILCYENVLGCCAKGTACKKVHLTKPQMPDQFIKDLLDLLKAGIEHFVNNPKPGDKRPAGGQ